MLKCLLKKLLDINKKNTLYCNLFVFFVSLTCCSELFAYLFRFSYFGGPTMPHTTQINPVFGYYMKMCWKNVF